MDAATAPTGSKQLEYLVLDAGALIRGHGLVLYKTAKKIITVPDVLAEIRDSKSRELLLKLPFEIEERTPSQSAINFVANFAKKTGDYAAISKTDLRLIALTHMLEIELNGKKYTDEVAKKSDIKSLTSQLEAVKSAGAAKESTDGSDASPVTKAPLPKPHVWATKSWATVLSGDTSLSAPVPEGSEETLPEVNEDEEEESEGESESSESDNDNEEDTEDNNVDEENNEVAAPVGTKVDITAAVDHFTAATVASLESLHLEDSLAEADASASFVTGFAEDCGCAHAATETHATHTHAPAAAAVKAPVVEEPASTEPWHSRMMRPSGLSTGNNPFTSAAESTKMRLEDDGKGWVNHSNLLQHRGRNGYSLNSHTAKKTKAPSAVPTGDEAASETPTDEQNSASVSAAKSDAPKKKKNRKRPTKVACLTTDFSMQNVMLQMSLRVMSVDGLMIKSAKQWVLRCMGCFEVHYDMDRLFCRKCGGHHLSRVSASVDSGGELRLHLKKNYHVELRGSKYSLPAPGKQGRYQGEILLREDQLLSGIWKQKCVKIRKDIKSAFGEDVTSDVGMHINKGQAIKIGMGKQNVNSAKGRERRGKSKGRAAK